METKVTITVTHVTYLDETNNTVHFLTVAGRLNAKLIKDSMQTGNIYIKHEHEKLTFMTPTQQLKRQPKTGGNLNVNII
jgi:hypothetical protein